MTVVTSEGARRNSGLAFNIESCAIFTTDANVLMTRNKVAVVRPPEPILGYREFVDRTCRDIFEDPTGQ